MTGTVRAYFMFLITVTELHFISYLQSKLEVQPCATSNKFSVDNYLETGYFEWHLHILSFSRELMGIFAFTASDCIKYGDDLTFLMDMQTI